MKRFVLAVLLVVAPAGASLADPDIGCGLGTQVWHGSKGTGPKVLGATTNGSFGNQTFGISFGTIGCHSGGTVTADAKIQMFANANLDRLARDMAAGRGEMLDSFAQLIGIRDADKPAFFEFTQAHFADLFASDEVTSSQMLASLERLMAADGRFASYVKS